MNILQRWFSHKKKWEQELSEELRFHIEQQTAANIAAGMSRDEARRQAMLQLGAVEGVKEYCREETRGFWLESVWADVRYGARGLRKSPGFAIVAILTLALGVGANTAIFSVVYAVLLRPLPYNDPGRLMLLWESNPKRGIPEFTVSPANFIDWRTQNHQFSQIAAIRSKDETLTGAGAPERVQVADVSPEFFELLGVQPERGRALQASDENPANVPVAIISDRLWQGELGGDPHVIGRVLTLGSKPRTIVGVAPPRFGSAFGEFQVWTPLILSDQERAARGWHVLSVIARLRTNTSLQHAEADMQTIAGQLEKEYPDTNAGWSVLLQPLREEVIGDIQTALLVLLGAVSLVLLIACANVANLQLSRTSARLREMAIRGALGAGRRRIVQQLLTESLLLSFAGSALGLLLAWCGTGALLSLDPAGIPRRSEIGINGYVLGFAAAIAIITALLFGLVPALQSFSIDLVGALKEGTGGREPSSSRLRHMLIVSEVALALVLLAGGGLLVRSFSRLLNVSPGLKPENVLTFGVELPDAKYPKKVDAEMFFHQLVARIQQVPGVDSAGAVSFLPLSGATYTLRFHFEGQAPTSPLQATSAQYRVVTPDYFRTMGIPLLRGRVVADADGPGAPKVGMINEAMARSFWPNADPIGQHIVISGPAPYQIVGIVGDVRQFGLDQSPKPEMYVAQNQEGWNSFTIVAHSKTAPLSLTSAIVEQVHALDKDLPVDDVRSMQQVIDESVGDQRFSTYLFTLFALLALLLAAIGIYGVTSYTVAQGTREIGIRMALGAKPGDVMRLVVGQGVRLTLAGVALGLTGALALTRFLQGMLFEVKPSDPLTFIGVAVLLLLVALLACYIPARRAMRVDPMVALRYE